MKPKPLFGRYLARVKQRVRASERVRASGRVRARESGRVNE